MKDDMLTTLIQVVLAYIVIPWITWVSVSIFNQKQELALIKQMHNDMSSLIKSLLEVFKK